MKNILLELSFVGTNYRGWQRQKNGLSIQEILETALSDLTREKIALTGCSRTDAGVHAEEFIANFGTTSTIPSAKFSAAMQTKLPRDIQVVSSKEVRSSFNSRRNSYEKTYRYQIYLGQSPFRLNRWWQYGGTPNIEVLKGLGDLIVGTHDFSGFCVLKSQKTDNRCTIKQATWSRKGKELYFKIMGDRFLHHMVRFLVGAQMEVAGGKLSQSEFETILQYPQKRRALYPAPPEGLYLAKVKYK